MAATGTAAARRLMLTIAGWQCVAGVVIAVAVGLGFDIQAAYSALIGGAIAAIGSASMALGVGAIRAEASPQRLLYGFMAGEIAKFLVTAGLFALVILTLDVSALAMLGTFIAAFIVYWVVLIKATSRLVP